MLNLYVDPGQGFVLVQNSSFAWGVVFGVLGALAVFFRMFFSFFRRYFWIIVVILACIFIGGMIMNRSMVSGKVVILGVDAMDPEITDSLIAGGRLPNLAYLKAQGSYSRLATVVPPESAVAWTSFSTGLNPGGHGIFDFVMRDPRTLQLYLSLNDIENTPRGVKLSLRKKGKDFWSNLSRHRVHSQIYFCPNTFPPEKLSGSLVSGMGVPDITGTMGRFSFYTTETQGADSDAESRGRIVRLLKGKKEFFTYLYGPRISSRLRQTEASIPLKISLDPGQKSITIAFGGKSFVLKEKEWSGWKEVSFKTGVFSKARGILKFYLVSAGPELNLYATAVNFDPRHPLFPISYPKDFSSKLAARYGLYYTQGMPHDTWALSEGRISQQAFLEQVDQILEDNEKILTQELRNFKSGLFFYYLETLDVVEHMFWRYSDKEHLFYQENQYSGTIAKYYEKIDAIVGKILGAMGKDTVFILVSDHGFAPFYRSVNLNRWLLENGYLFLKEGKVSSDGFFENIDWSRTRAYALGFGGIYINRQGRERYGIVTDAERTGLIREISTGLKRLVDPQTGSIAIKNIYESESVYAGQPYVKSAPDIFVGFNRGYRASWQTALGGVPEELFSDNRKEWSGDHLVDPDAVPGVWFSNRRISFANPSILDVAPTVIGLFGADIPDTLNGRRLFKKGDQP